MSSSLPRLPTRRRVLLGGLSFAVLAPLGRARAAAPMEVVASFSILGDLVRQVGGERVSVTTLVQPGGDAHVYEPAPADVQRLARARLVLVNGLGLEGWIPRLVQAAAAKARVVVATAGIDPRQAPAEGGEPAGIDPHAWQSVPNARIYVANIRDGLSAADPDGVEIYTKAAETYLARLDTLDREVRAAVATIPAGRRKIITTHDAFGYFAAAYGVAMIAPQGVSTESEPSARDVARIIRQIRSEKIPAIFLENVTDPRLLQRIAAESGARVGGTLYSDSLSPPGGPAGTYIDMVRHNIRELTAALMG
jgi:zinc/manganese transport system substrate-binding protein